MFQFITFNKHTGTPLQVVTAPEDEMAWYITDDVDVLAIDSSERDAVLAGELRVSSVTGNLTRLLGG